MMTIKQAVFGISVELLHQAPSEVHMTSETFNNEGQGSPFTSTVNLDQHFLVLVSNTFLRQLL